MLEVESRIRKNHSPQQISGRLRVDYPDDPKKQVSAETIYTYIYEKAKSDQSLQKNLRHGKKKRCKRILGKEKRNIIRNKVSIDLRPREVETKQVWGHWEGDTVEGAMKMGYIGTFVERKHKILVAFHLLRKKADLLADATIKAFKGIPSEYLKTITFDNGTEFARHQKISKKLGVAIYFAHPYCSWERGLNEHANGLLRQYYPKKQMLLDLTNRQLAKSVNEINNRPRKCLNYLTPAESFARELCALQI